jgi:tRNA threonylcarbamoyladenosine biosynthesis protein TsaE
MDTILRSIGELDGVVTQLISFIHAGYKIILLSGDLGSGKTTLTKSIFDKLGVTEPVSSPTFSLVNEYASPGYGPLYHMDLYRLEKPDDLVQIGFEEYLESGNICLIEWPDLAQSYFSMPHIVVEIQVAPDHTRIFNITTHDSVDA